jgi:hypothetical protein
MQVRLHAGPAAVPRRRADAAARRRLPGPGVHARHHRAQPEPGTDATALTRSVCRLGRWLTPVMLGWGGSRTSSRRHVHCPFPEGFRRAVARVQARGTLARVRGDRVRGAARGGASLGVPAVRHGAGRRRGRPGLPAVAARRLVRRAVPAGAPDQAQSVPARPALPQRLGAAVREPAGTRPDVPAGHAADRPSWVFARHPPGRDGPGARAVAQPGLRRGGRPLRGRGCRLPVLVRALAGDPSPESRCCSCPRSATPPGPPCLMP